MRAILKVLGIVVAAAVLLFVAAVIGVALLVDPNDYKDQIRTAVAEATGRDLTLEGNLELKVFPRIVIATGPAQISNAAGFGTQPFARIESARLQLELLPLLSKRVEIGEARLQGLVLNLARNARGVNNWQDLGQSSAAAAPPSPESPPAQGGGAAGFDFDVNAIEIDDAAVNWSDAASGSSWQLAGFNLQASQFGPAVPFPLELDFTLTGKAVEVAVRASTTATLTLAGNQYRLENLRVDIDGSGSAWPGGSGEAEVGFDSFGANLDEQTLDLRGLRMNFLGLTVTGNLTGRKLFGDMTLAGDVDIEPFDPRDVLDALQVELQTADPDALRQAQAKARFVHDPGQSMLEDLQLTLDDSRLTGQAGLKGKALSFDLGIDSINFDRYLPPAAEESGTAEEGSLDEVDLPLDALGALEATGKLAVGQAQFAGLHLGQVALSLAAHDGRVELKPQAALYDGRYSGSVLLRVQDDAARISLDQGLENVDLAPLGKDLLGSVMISGTGSAQLKLTGTGSNLGAVRRGLDGDVAFTLSDGAWEGVDMWYELRRARAVTSGNQAPPREGEPRTPFSSIAATGTVEDAVLTNRDLEATLPFMAVNGAGTVNLLTEAMDFDMTAKLVDGPTLQSDPAMADLAGTELPLKIGGTLTAPSVRPDFAAAVKARAEQRAREKVEEKTEELKQRLQDRVRGLFGQ